MPRSIQSITFAALAAAACGGGDDAENLEINVEFLGQAAELSTNSLHFWILEATPRAGEEPVGCRELALAEASPYDLKFARHADIVVVTAEATGTTAEGIPNRPLLVYVEGVDYLGRSAIAGCETFNGADISLITVALRNRGALDCADPETPDGAACDDGVFCTVGETCQGGSCQGGGPRDCTHLADACNGESCTEELGCQPAPVPDETPCTDGMTCTAGDTCQAGVCESGGPRDCTAIDDDCNVGMCEEGINCVAVPTNLNGPCATTCGGNSTCDASGVCVEEEESDLAGNCADTEDNDCDGFADALDSDCTPPA